jgi:hypothetical protein
MDEDNNVFKSILTAAVNLGIKIIDFLLGAFLKIKPEDIADAIASMFQSIFDMISGAISENSPGLGEAGSKIGEFLGKSIAFTGDLIKRLCDNLIEMINDPTNAQKFGEVGSAIVTAIMKGMVGFTDAIMSWIFGKEYDDQKAALIQQQKKNEVGAQVANAAGDKAQNLLGAVYDPKVSLENAWTAAYGYKTAMLPNKFTDQEYDRMGVHGQMMKDAGAVKEPEKLEGYAKDLWSSLFKAMGAAKSPEEYVYAVDAMKKFRDDWNSGKVDKKQVQDEAYAAWDTLTNWADKHPVVFKVVLQDGNGNPITYIRDMLQGWFGPESDYSGVTPDKSIGGVFNQPTRIRVGEGGSDEYVIPTDNPERRDALIMKMFSSMGNSARGLLNRLGYNMGAFDQGAPGMGGKYPAAMFPSGSNVSNSRILNSKTDINVYGSGNAEAAGRAAYRAASVNLVHDAKGVFAE